MFQNLPSDPVVTGLDPGTSSTGVHYYVVSNSTAWVIVDPSNTFNTWGNEPFFRFEKPNMIRPHITRVFAKFLSDAEKAYLRKINFNPTREGVQVCHNWHDRSPRWIRSMPQLQVRFDRRLPCWRAGRWKSLT